MQNVERTSEMRPVIRSQWGYKGTAYGCMNCGYGVILPIFKYCPNCGAVMSDEVAGKIAPDRVDVIRCMDCTNYNTAGCFDGFGWCEKMDRGVHDGFFCANGERRED